MSGSLRLNGSTSGFSEITAPDVAGDQTFTLPAVGGTLPVYQQGIWTPYAAANDFSLCGVSSYAAQYGNWVRVGNHVTLNWWMRANNTNWSYINGVSGDSSFYIAGLPYDVANTTPYGTGAGNIAYIQGLDDDTQFRCYPQTGANTPLVAFVSLVLNSGKYKDTQAVYREIFSAIGSAIQGSVQYITNDTTFVPINGATIS